MFWKRKVSPETPPTPTVDTVNLHIDTVVFNVSVISESVHEPATAIVAFDEKSLKRAGAEVVMQIIDKTKPELLERLGLTVHHEGPLRRLRSE